MIQRYFPALEDEYGPDMVKGDSGGWVKYEEYDKVIELADRLRIALSKQTTELNKAIKYIDDLEALNPGMDTPESENKYKGEGQ